MELEGARRAAESIGDSELEAELDVNDLELRAFRDIFDPTDEFTAVHELLRDLGARHEDGKAYTAAALAFAMSGSLATAREHVEEARRILDSCGYKSGLGRAHLVAACIEARAGAPEEAQRAAKQAVAELEAASVYPTLIVFASHLLDRIGAPDAEIRAAERRALAGLLPSQAELGLRTGVAEVMDRLLDDGLSETIQVATNTTAKLSGHYHDNVRVGSELVRSERPCDEPVDLTIWDEDLVLSAVSKAELPVPRLIAVSHSPEAAVHEWIDGSVLSELHPKFGAPDDIGSDLAGRLARFIANLGRVPIEALPPLPDDWPDDGDSPAFAELILKAARAACELQYSKHPGLFERLNFPSKPLERADLKNVTERPFQLLHCDVHRHNVIVKPDNRFVVIDWELALWGDPVYDLAVHLHKIDYSTRDEASATNGWLGAMRSNDDMAKARQIYRDLESYRKLEIMKSAVVDTVRTADEWEGTDQAVAVAALHRKIRRAFKLWDRGVPPTQVELTEVLSELSMKS